jgi:hypothetical protein
LDGVTRLPNLKTIQSPHPTYVFGANTRFS